VRISKQARKELLAYLGCGLLCRGFARLKCPECSETRLVVTRLRALQLQGPRVLPIVHGPADERHGRKPGRTRAAAFNLAAAVGDDLPVLVETEARPGR
jgi:hypothetical protein